MAALVFISVRNTDVPLGVRSGIFDMFSLVTIVLYLVFVCVTGGISDSLWVVVHVDNCLIQLTIVGKLASPETDVRTCIAATGFAYALEEALAIAGMFLHFQLPQTILAPASLAVLPITLLSYGAICARFATSAQKRSSGGALEDMDRFAHAMAQQGALPEREVEMLRHLLAGNSQATNNT